MNHILARDCVQNNSSRKPVYLAIEGLKGVGKGSVLQGIYQELKHREISYVPLNPTQPLEAQHPWERLDQTLHLRSSDWWRKHLYATRSQEHTRRAQQQVRDAEARAQPIKLILGDRCILTSLVTRWPHRNTVMDLEVYYQSIRALERYIPIPDHIIYLNAPLEVIEARIAQRTRNYGKEDERRARLLEAQDAYQQMRQGAIPSLKQIEWREVDATQSLSEVQEEVLHQVLSLLA